MGAAILSDLLTEILIPVAAIIGIAFSLIQWLLVSRVKLSPERHQPSGGNKNGGLSDYLIEEEEGLNDHSVVAKCADIQNAIAEGSLRWKSDLSLSLFGSGIVFSSFPLSHCRSCLLFVGQAFNLFFSCFCCI